MIGLCSVTLRDKDVEEIIALVKDAGLEVIEWGSDVHVPETDPENAKNVAKMMHEADLETSSYGSYYKLGSFDDFKPYIEIAKILGASIIRVWGGETGSEETTSEMRAKIVEDAERIGEMARAENLEIAIEYHRETLTDTPESAEQLMKEIDTPNVLLYWQPAESLSVTEQIESLPKLAPWITNVHVFHWENFHHRFPLEDGFDEWKQYIDIISEQAPHEHNFLLEFVPNDSVEDFYESTETLKKLVQ